GKRKYVIGYFIVGHPGEGWRENNYLRDFILKHLGYFPQQIQIFTPTPGTVSTAMYYSGLDPFTGEKVHVERSLKVRNKMKENVLFKKKGREKR
ncbi:MAG TPA: YgiQ family radical SAM protein, partial [Thermotoga naphthophila]|nr:YgiQ family radical SAM protein [Thermotoga petrophila]